jgi:hypothetical protein
MRIATMVGAGLAALGLMVPTFGHAYGDGTPDEQPPAEERICDPNAALRGAAYGLCVAYCEANDCETQPDKHACLVILANFIRITDEDTIPCASGGGGGGGPQ